MQTVLVDTNTELSCIPVSLASLSWWGSLGVDGCPVHTKPADPSFLKPVKTCGHVLSLSELAARFIHSHLKSKRRILTGIIIISLFFKVLLQDSAKLWLPEELCSLLQLPLGLRSWLVPSGRCLACQKVYFQYYFAMLVSGMFYKKLDARGRCKPDDLALWIGCCSSQCAMYYFSAY